MPHFCFSTKTTGKVDLIIENNSDEAFDIGFLLKDLVGAELKKVRDLEPKTPEGEELTNLFKSL